PGSPYENEQKLTDSQIEILNQKYGFDKPIPVQYVKYVTNVAKGDLGNSFQYDGRSVLKIIGDRLGVSAELGIESILCGLFFGLILGIIAALRQGTVTDYGAVIAAVIGISVPSFLFAVLLQYAFAMHLDWFPVAYWDTPASRILPIIAL